MINFTKNKRILCSTIAISTILVGCSDPVDRKTQYTQYDDKPYDDIKALLYDQINKIENHIDDVHRMSDVDVSKDVFLNKLEDYIDDVHRMGEVNVSKNAFLIAVDDVSRLRQIAQQDSDEYNKKIEKLKKRVQSLSNSDDVRLKK